MDTVLMAMGIVLAAAITPGPNNFFVLGAAVDGGVRGAAVTGAGILAGSAMLLIVVWLGAATLFSRVPGLQSAVVVAGAIYLSWMGLSLARSARRSDAPKQSVEPISWRRVAVFQLVNPKAWWLVTTVTVLMTESIASPWSLALLAAVVLGVSTACLTAWALAGLSLSTVVRSPRFARRLDRTMGMMLIVIAAWVMVDHLG